MGKIKQLDTLTANMIAAGEVVERPMGVVKELVENAIDAGSTRIEVNITEGGIQRLSVIDNGCGMDSQDAQLCFGRHATSKIQSQNDLWSIHTLGFRGEALPSISSVSRMVLNTSDGKDATRVVIAYGKIESVTPYPCNQGTEISVEGLFYHTPARLKHMRSAAYEASLIQDVVSKFALSHPEIAFILRSDDRESFRTSGQGNLLEVVYQVFGRMAAEYAVPVNFQDYDYTVKGFIIKPNITRASRTGMNIFLNGRMVRTYKLYKSVQDGYEDFIVKGRYPICVLDITMDPHLLDVNVHPSKWEVRLSKEIQLETLIQNKIANILRTTILAPEAEVREARQEYYQPLSFDTDRLIQEAEIRKEQQRQQIESQPHPQQPVQETITLEKEIEETQQELQRISIQFEETYPEYKPQQQVFPPMEVIGQLHEKFILCAAEKGLVIIDQHAAQERVHYEEYKAKLNQDPAMMDCLVPITIHAGSDLVSRVDEINAAVVDVHVVFEPFGKDTLVVHSVPVWMQDLDETQFLNDVIDLFKNDRDIKYARMEKKKIATMACHHSIRFNRSLTMDEMKEVVRQLSLCQNPYHCPHGRPTFITLDEKTLVKEFLR
ncbi:MAG: DNA mismatch repair endonuclease MutL [Erysipelotrichaceae bacterium]|nr:DNA mismatch repair endonuclease MutL [Erysipelotrichaceae bacterium]